MPPRKRCPTGWSKDIDGKCYPKPGTDITKRPDIALAHGFTSVTNYAMGGPRSGVTTNFAPQRPTYTPKNPPPKPRSYNPFAALGPLTPHYHPNDWNADTRSYQDAKNMWSNKPHLWCAERTVNGWRARAATYWASTRCPRWRLYNSGTKKSKRPVLQPTGSRSARRKVLAVSNPPRDPSPARPRPPTRRPPGAPDPTPPGPPIFSMDSGPDPSIPPTHGRSTSRGSGGCHGASSMAVLNWQ